jgi:hypothetical protein
VVAEDVREIAAVTIAVFSIVGVVVGGLLNFFLQKWQEERRWKREDESRFAPERLSLYRDFVNEMERVRSGERFERELLWRQIAEMEVLSSRAAYSRAVESVQFAEENWAMLCGEEEPPVARDSDGEEVPFDREDVREMLETRTYRFIRTVRNELGVSTDFRPLVITLKGKPLGTPEDIQEIEDAKEQESRPWWRRMFGS